MPFIKVDVHFVWATKKRYPFLFNKSIRRKVWRHIREYGRSNNIYVDFVDGYSDHCHCLISMNSTQTIGQIMHLIKGESSRWINEQGFCNELFEWQNDYYAVSVSESNLQKVRNYIRNQERHHQKKSFRDECKEFNFRYKFKDLPAVDASPLDESSEN